MNRKEIDLERYLEKQGIREAIEKRVKELEEQKYPVSDIDRIVIHIREKFNPDKIILFSPHENGKPEKDTKIELLIIMPVEGLKRDKIVDIDVALWDIGLFPLTILATPDDVEENKSNIDSVIYHALNHGLELWKKPVKSGVE